MTRPALLLVEDDELVLLITADLLAEMGFAVRQARSAREAMAAIDPGVEVLVTDIGLPDADGRDLARRVREQVPAIAVVIVSGDPGEEAGAIWLTKPFDTAALRGALQEARDRRLS